MAETSKTTFRSTGDLIGSALLLIGVVGFFVCWGIGRNAEQQVLGRAELRHPSDKRTAQIEMKGVAWYVEPGFAHRYNTASDFSGIFWVVGAAGGAMKERKRIASWWKSRRTQR